MKGSRELSSEPSRKRRRLNEAVNPSPFSGASDAQVSHYQSTSQSGNQISTTARERGNGGGEAEQPPTEIHEDLRSRPIQWERESIGMPFRYR